MFSSLSAVSYIRVSTGRQAERGGEREGFSIPAQREANRRQAHGLGALISAEFVDRGQSGRSTNRPELQRMLTYLRKHPVDYVIVHKLDRLARSRADDIAITQAVHASGARLISSTEGIDATPNGTLLHGIMASIAEFYSRNLAQEVMKGMRQKAIQGGTPGRAPIGYLNVRRQTEDGREYRAIQLDRERAPHIAWAFDTYATGEWSVTQLTSALTDRGLRTRATASRSPAALTVASLHGVLTNPYYKGIVTLNGAQHAGSHEPLVTAKTWETVQHLLTSRRQGERSRIHTHYLKSTVRCFNCQRRLLVHNARSKSGRVYDYFICSGRQNGTPRCTQSALRISDVERRVEDAYERIQISTHRRKEIELHWQDRLAAEASGSEQKRSDLAAQAQEIRLRQEKLLEAYYSDALPRNLFVKEQRKLADSLSRTEAEEERLSDDVTLQMKHLAESLDLLEDACNRYLAAAPADSKQLNNALLDRVLIGPNPEDIYVELRPEIAKLGLRAAAEEHLV
ncbi:recombinase family protein [Microbacterium sp. YMB-B2]|uniref:Recombinase family protein n=1 Tax=Microbacterium tenebrionis TaxID=2830665 RepID=A0A9X1S1S1_9MICO|nr:recombinase family protein [Microbacterium tenebrionis]